VYLSDDRGQGSDDRYRGTSVPVKRSSSGRWQAQVRARSAARRAKGTDVPARRLRGSESEKMSTFVSAISPVESMQYTKFTSTFAYLLEKAGLGKSRT
jgi:hypothetical protein